MPWRNYIPKAAWLLGQYNAHKLSHEEFIEMSAAFRTGHEGRKRDAEAAMADERKHAVRRHVAEELAALRRDDPLLPARHFDEVTDFLSNFAGARWRRPILAIVGGTNLGKSVLARDVLRQLADKLGLPRFLEVTVQGDAEPSLENFDHRNHAGVLFDGVGNAQFLHTHREVLQGQPKETKGGRSATMKFAYPYTLCRQGVVATFDLSAQNLGALQTNHWLADPRNVIVLNLTSRVRHGSAPGRSDRSQKKKRPRGERCHHHHSCACLELSQETTLPPLPPPAMPHSPPSCRRAAA